MATPIPPLAKSIYRDAPDDGYRRTFDELSARLSAETNWFARKKLLLESLKALEIVIQYEQVAAQGAGETITDDPRTELTKVVPYFIGGILEKLAEPEISSVEQAAFYVLSAHPEHQEAAERWMEADPRHVKAFRKFMKANRYYKQLLDDGAEAYGGFPTA